VPDAAWLRLRHTAERQGTAVLVSAPWRIVGAAASAAVVMHATKPIFVDAGGPLLAALETSASVERIVGISPPPANEQTMVFSADTFPPPRLPSPRR